MWLSGEEGEKYLRERGMWVGEEVGMGLVGVGDRRVVLWYFVVFSF